MDFNFRICVPLTGCLISTRFFVVLLQVRYEGKAAVWILHQGIIVLLDRLQGKYGCSMFLVINMISLRLQGNRI